MNGGELREQMENRNRDHDDDEEDRAYSDGIYDDDEPCYHDHDENCENEWGYGFGNCTHQHCMNCGGCQCPGYCDDHQTYNLRPPSETGGPEGSDYDEDDQAEQR